MVRNPTNVRFIVLLAICFLYFTLDVVMSESISHTSR